MVPCLCTPVLSFFILWGDIYENHDGVKEELRKLHFEEFRVKRGTEEEKQEVKDKLKKCRKELAKLMLQEAEEKERGGMKKW